MITRMPPTARDFLWFDERFPDLAEAYCFTVVHGVPPEQVLSRFGATEQSRLTGVRELMGPAFTAWDEHEGDLLFLGATAVGDWTLVVEPNGFLGVTEAAIVPLSRGTRLVSHFRNVNAVDYFFWVDDGTIRLHFEPLFPTRRDGTHADGLLDVMERIGFDLQSTDGLEVDRHSHPGECAFALAEYLTGVRITPELLESAPFVCGTAPFPAT
jgi:hypothetical protein